MKQEDLLKYESQRDDVLKTPFISYEERVSILKKIKSIIKENINNINFSLKKDLNKHENEVYFSEIGLILNEIRFVLKNLKKWMKPKKVKTPLALFSGASKIIQQALGHCLIISPWNYPFYLTFMPLISAIAAGNRVIIKTSELSKHSSSLIMKIINEDLKTDKVYVMSSDVNDVKEMLKNKFDFVFFTGSERVGKLITEQVSRFHTPITLELGGKCPVILDDSADLRNAANKIMTAKFINSGQTCVAPDYIVVPKNKGTKFIEYCQDYINAKLDKLENYPKIISEEHHKRIMGLIPNDVNVQYTDTQILPKAFISDWNNKIMKQEVFGPLLPVIEYQDFSEIVRKISEKSEPLATYVFTKEKKFVDEVFKNIRTGALVINDLMVQLANHYLPFGGVGASGHGRSRGYAGFLEFSNSVSYYRRTWFSTELSEHPYSELKLKILKKIIK
ncbi:aldehyde dehydrogenase family protein [Mycoplasma zalophidermidis]|uniref:Aldehyde dehydrogenase n=1 Tax=Mycoplasma zalophidermidis TaxID=398174 RepID=A0ABS6DRC9_9MOLU|nr:aldehyde dehydrogenase family protein [Mycoplasma zalophidermidis]MBU4689498.1 aldehyde dehydrogenase family protein [Mycoplasma zalophidermidis]MBU4693376.1 aldehyde dehydrogenase family protein [Mycoplasma zalophidermidis]MCR8966326.1 aldehyde dehydrogenase family protein [Mycoplasma zalophidermidis]